MSLQELKKQAHELSVSDRLELVSAIVRSLEVEFRPRPQLPEDFVDKFIGLAKTDAPPPTDAEVKQMLEERMEENYLT